MVLLNTRIRTERSLIMSNTEYSAEHRAIQDPNKFGNKMVYVDEDMLIVSDAEKLDYLYQVALKVGKLVESITPAQVEQVKRLQSNPLMSKLFSGIVKG